MNYKEEAQKFADKYGVKLAVIGTPEYRKHFPDDKQSRYVFKLRLTRTGRKYTFHFGQSIADGCKAPDLYDVLSCLTKYDPGTFENFCDEYGYNTDSRNAERIYKAVCKEFAAVDRLFSDCIDDLDKIV